MTAKDIISAVDELKPNEYTKPQKLAWLTQLDRQLLVDVILKRLNSIYRTEPSEPQAGDLWLDGSILKRYSDGNQAEWAEVFPYTSEDDVLLFDEYAREVYIWYLITQIDLFNMEYTRYNNSSAMLNQAYADLERRYNRSVGLPDYRWNIF